MNGDSGRKGTAYRNNGALCMFLFKVILSEIEAK
jgi:hypothetical protein